MTSFKFSAMPNKRSLSPASGGVRSGTRITLQCADSPAIMPLGESSIATHCSVASAEPLPPPDRCPDPACREAPDRRRQFAETAQPVQPVPAAVLPVLWRWRWQWHKAVRIHGRIAATLQCRISVLRRALQYTGKPVPPAVTYFEIVKVFSVKLSEIRQGVGGTAASDMQGGFF